MQRPAHRSCMNRALLQYECGYEPEDCLAERMHVHRGDICKASLQYGQAGVVEDASVG